MPVRPHILALAWRLVLRDWRSGELSILAGALVIAVAGTTTVSLLGHRLTRTVETQTAEFLAADLVVSGHAEPSADWATDAENSGLAYARTVEFPSVLVEGEKMQLSGVKAVSSAYPLRGTLVTSTVDAFHGEPTAHGPPPGEAWADARILSALNLQLGKAVTVGETPLKLTRILVSLPDARGDLFGMSPQVLINLGDLAATRVIQPGSHAHYYSLFAGAEGDIGELKGRLKAELKPGQKLMDIREDRPELGKALTRAERYLGLSTIAIVVIAGVAIAMSARRYTRRHYDLTAMLKCLGASRRDVLLQHLSQYLIIGLSASTLGALLGYLAQFGVVRAMQPLLPRDLVAPGWTALAFGPAIGLFVLLGFALPTILQIRHLPPLRVLRRDLAPMGASGWLVYGLAATTTAALTWRYAGDVRLTAWVLSIGCGVVAATGVIVHACIIALRNTADSGRVSWRLGMRNLTRTPHLATSQVLAFGLTMTAMLLVLLVRTELIDEWRRQLPSNVPNHFAMNLMDQDLLPFQQQLAEQGVATSDFYPIVRGRLTRINGTDAHQVALRETEGEAAINRELNLTYTRELPAENRIVDGSWWHPEETGPQISIEEKLAASLKIKLGDTLSFVIADQTREARVTSIRRLRWDTMKPNFYVIFPPGSLEQFPHTHLGSFHLPDERLALLPAIIKSFPAVTVLDINALLKQVQSIVREVTLAVEFVLTFALAAGIAVLGAAARSSLDERIREQALLRVMGAKSPLLRRALALEFSTLGLLAGVMATILTELIVWALFKQVFDLEARAHWTVWMGAPLFGTLAIGLAGYGFTYRALRTEPDVVLRTV